LGRFYSRHPKRYSIQIPYYRLSNRVTIKGDPLATMGKTSGHIFYNLGADITGEMMYGEE
jgi:hypothetical protein